MSVGTAFHARTAPLNRKMQWREWSGYFASSVYADAHDIEYNAIREAAALIDVSPLYKYIVSGPDALRLVDRVITRDATKLAVGRRLLHAVVRRARQGRRRRHDPSTRRGPLPLDGRRPAAALAAAEQRRPRRDDHGRDRGNGRARAAGTRCRATCWRPRPASHSPTSATSDGAASTDRPASRSTCRGPATPATSATSCGSRPSRRSPSGTP